METYDLSGTLIPPERLHITLHWLDDHSEVPYELLQRAMRAGASVEMAPFDVGFDRIGSFGRKDMGGLMLTGSAELQGLRRLQRTLATAMNCAGIGHFSRKRFRPHISLLYCDPHVAAEPIAPIRWRVNELVLIESLVGRSRHVQLGSWPLREQQMSFNWL